MNKNKKLRAKNKKIFLFIILSLLLFTTVVYANETTKSIKLPIEPGEGVRITSGFGNRIHPITGKRTFHSGIDIAAPKGTYVYAFMDGVVTMAKGNGNAGNEIRIKHEGGLESRYLHMSKKAVEVGDKVQVGRVIGTVGDTGRATGAHLHFEVRKDGKAINPIKIKIKEGE